MGQRDNIFPTVVSHLFPSFQLDIQGPASNLSWRLLKIQVHNFLKISVVSRSCPGCPLGIQGRRQIYFGGLQKISRHLPKVLGQSGNNLIEVVVSHVFPSLQLDIQGAIIKLDSGAPKHQTGQFPLRFWSRHSNTFIQVVVSCSVFSSTRRSHHQTHFGGNF